MSRGEGDIRGSDAEPRLKPWRDLVLHQGAQGSKHHQSTRGGQFIQRNYEPREELIRDVDLAADRAIKLLYHFDDLDGEGSPWDRLQSTENLLGPDNSLIPTQHST